MKRRVKPFTLFLCAIILLFIVFGPKLIYNGLKKPSSLDLMMSEEPEWSGIVKIWHVDYIQCGKGSVEGWLKSAIDEIESRYLDVFFEVRNITPERLNMYFQSGIDRDLLPDIISLSPYEDPIPRDMLEDIGEYLHKDSLDLLIDPAREAVQIKDAMIGIPYMVGWYTFILNGELREATEGPVYGDRHDIQDWDWASLGKAVEETSEEHFGFVSYSEPHSKPINCVGSPQIRRWKESGVTPDNVEEMTYLEAWRLFGVQGEASVFMGPTRAIYDMRASWERGEGFKAEIVPIPELRDIELDQIGIYGIIRQEDEYKKLICMEFLTHLIDDNMQRSLGEIGMFAVREDIKDIYDEDRDMKRLEGQLNGLYKFEK